jgi:hypothetical protein
MPTEALLVETRNHVRRDEHSDNDDERIPDWKEKRPLQPDSRDSFEQQSAAEREQPEDERKDEPGNEEAHRLRGLAGSA